MIPLPFSIILLLTAATTLLTSGQLQAAQVERIELHQLQSVQIKHQRRGGNVRAQAQRQGWIVRVPQLYVYLSDYSPVFHMDGYRSTLLRDLSIRVDRSRTERTTIRLDRLLENTETLETAEPFTQNDLPPADLYIVFYNRPDCEDCDRVRADLDSWLEERESLNVVWLDVTMDLVL
ncbi:MAG: hypothetical protein AAGJ52_07605 [Pseudomonadota bacterium]